MFSLFMCYQTAGGGVSTLPLDLQRGEEWTEVYGQVVLTKLKSKYFSKQF